MAGTVGVITRLQAKKMKEAMSRHGSTGKCRTSKDVLAEQDEENVGVVSTAVYNRRSFPLEHESGPWSREYKKGLNTESSMKQRPTLQDRSNSRDEFQITVFPKHSQLPQSKRGQATPDSEELPCQDEMESKDQDLDLNRFSSVPANVSMESVLAGETLPSNQHSHIFDNIRDIDENPDSLTTTVYSKENMEYLMLVETRDHLKPGFLDNSPGVTSRMRGVLMDWLLQVQNHEELKDETLHLCVFLIDKFLSIVDVKMPRLQLVGITCLLIASKFSERFAPEISTLCYLTDNTFVKDQVLQYERFILQTLDFDLARPVCTSFLDRFLQVHSHIPEVEYLARYLLDLSITNIHMVAVLPSMKAASALYLTRRLVLDNVETWSADLQYYTNYREQDIYDWANEFANLLIKAPDSRFQGARTKYSIGDYCSISQCDRVKPAWVLLCQFV